MTSTQLAEEILYFYREDFPYKVAVKKIRRYVLQILRELFPDTRLAPVQLEALNCGVTQMVLGYIDNGEMTDTPYLEMLKIAKNERMDLDYLYTEEFQQYFMLGVQYFLDNL